MATIRNFGLIAQLRSEASHHIIAYKGGAKTASGRGLAIWFAPPTASIAEIPMDDRETTLYVTGRSKDFQDVAVQGTVSWHVRDPERLAERIDFTIHLRKGRLNSEPVEKIEARIIGLAEQAALQYLAEMTVRDLLDAGPDPMRVRMDMLLAKAPALEEIGIAVVAVRLGKLTPTVELERALQTPTFEALQQKADEAVFERRALAVDKERAIAENELANRTELAKRQKQLISEESANEMARAKAKADAGLVEAEAEAARIRAVEGARAQAERGIIDIYRDLPQQVLLGLAARDFAGKLEGIEHLNVTPDLLASMLGAWRNGQPAAPAK